MSDDEDRGVYANVSLRLQEVYLKTAAGNTGTPEDLNQHGAS